MATELTVRHKDIALLELLDRVLDKGVLVAGDLTISVADIDLIYVGLRLLLCSVETLEATRAGTGGEQRETGLEMRPVGL